MRNIKFGVFGLVLLVAIVTACRAWRQARGAFDFA